MDSKEELIIKEESINSESNIDTTKKEGKQSKEKKKNIFVEWGLPILLAFILAMLINKFLLYKVYIPSGSMIPTLNIGDHLYVTRVYNLENITRGDVIVFYSEELNDTLIKRVIGLPGDEIDIVNGVVSVNGEILKEDYVKNNDNFTGSYKVPEDRYFFLGDNRRDSFDSRKWDKPFIEKENIQGKAQIKVYPFSDFGSIK